LQSLREQSLHGQGPSAEDVAVVGVSGGAYIAAAQALDPDLLRRDSQDEQRLRNATHYLAPDAKTVATGILSLLWGAMVVSVIGLASVYAAANALGWVLKATGALVVSDGKLQAAHVPRVSWVVCVLFGAPALIAYSVWRRAVTARRQAIATVALGWLLAFFLLSVAALVVTPLVIGWLYSQHVTSAYKPPVWVPVAVTPLASVLFVLARTGISHIHTADKQLTELPAAKPITTRLRSWTRRVLVAWLAVAVLVVTVVVFALAWVFDAAQSGRRAPIIDVLVAVAILLVARLCVDLNRLSMHDYYQQRLADAYGATKKPADQPPAKRCRLSQLSTRDGGGGDSGPPREGSHAKDRLLLVATANVTVGREIAPHKGGYCLTFSPQWVSRRRCVVEPADVLNPRRVRGQIAWASSVNAAATRVVGGASRLSS
jgi:hypothetical protein